MYPDNVTVDVITDSDQPLFHLVLKEIHGSRPNEPIASRRIPLQVLISFHTDILYRSNQATTA